MALIFRSRADPSYVLGVRSDSCTQGGWVGLLPRSAPTLLVSWTISEGIVRPRANPGCVLSLADETCQNGGWVHLAESDSILGQWVFSGNCLRAKGNLGFVLCARRDFQGIHLWSFDGLPDQYGQWDVEDVAVAVAKATLESSLARPRLGSTGSSTGGILQPVISKLRSALMMNDPEDQSEAPRRVLDMRSEYFVEALQCLVLVLERLGWQASSFLQTDTQKLTRFYTKSGKASYRAWLLSETAVHAETGYQEYADDSVAMANLWVARNLSFLSELFSLLPENLETADVVNLAYARTLQKHHTFLQRQAFTLVYGQLPVREQLLNLFEGEVQLNPGDVLQEIIEMGQLTKEVTDFAFGLAQEMDQKISAEKVQFEVDTAYGRA